MSAEDTDKKLMIGLGSGRSGTASLASLIDSQNGGLCFHEMNPSGAVFEGNPQAQLNAVVELQQILHGGPPQRLSIDYSRPASVANFERLQTMEAPELLGDIGFYYLNYVEDILEKVPHCRFVCLKRDREQTIKSWLRKSRINRWPSLKVADRLKSWITRTPYYLEYNYWQAHSGDVWKEDPVWDSCFPKFNASTKREAIAMYWDAYYDTAERLASAYPESFRIFDTGVLSSRNGQESVLSFVGLTRHEMVLADEVHLHRSS